MAGMSAASRLPTSGEERGGCADVCAGWAVRAPEETRVRRRRIANLAAVLMALMLTASGCGGSNDKTEVLRLRSANPLTSDLYVRIRGPAGAVSLIAQGLTTGGFSSNGEGSFVPPDLHQQTACSFSHTIRPADAPNLQAWRGRKMTITVYGNNSYAAIYCQGIRAGIYEPRS